MLGAAEFTMIGNVLMGMMAIGGVCSMIYSFGSYMSESPQEEWKNVGTAEAQSESLKKAA